ncbi:uncharacterized protein ACIQIH_005324 isoform 1-T1 [Cyanocitta cristata]
MSDSLSLRCRYQKVVIKSSWCECPGDKIQPHLSGIQQLCPGLSRSVPVGPGLSRCFPGRSRGFRVPPAAARNISELMMGQGWGCSLITCRAWRNYEAQIRNYRGPDPLEPWDRSLQRAGECLPLQEKQSRWPGLLEELVKVFVGDKRCNELLPGSPGLFPNVIPWLSPKGNRGNPGGGGGKRCRSVGGIPGKWRAAEAARTELEAGSSRQRTPRTATSPSRTAGMSCIALVLEWERPLGALAGAVGRHLNKRC